MNRLSTPLVPLASPRGPAGLAAMVTIASLLWAATVVHAHGPSGATPRSAVAFEPDDVTPIADDAGSSEPVQRIATEQPDGVAERVYFHYSDPDVALRSYAVADIGNCTGTMIGPNVMLTAAHCGMQNHQATFHIYVDENTKLNETFDCEYLTHTFPDMDLLLLWVYPNAAGENAGDKYGYVDFDIDFNPSQPGQFDYGSSRARVTAGTELYSIWTNPIIDIGGGWHTIYSEGQITDPTTADHWASPTIDNGSDILCSNTLCVGGAHDGLGCGYCAAVDPGCPDGECNGPRPSNDLGVTTDLWSDGGASGSSQLSVVNHRIAAAPLSIGTSDGPLRRSPAIADYLYWAFTDRNLTQPGACGECYDNQINETLLPQLGITNPTLYYDYCDLNLDGQFDVQEMLELTRGENARDWYWLGFESHRRGELWSRLLTWEAFRIDTSDPLNGTAAVSTVGQTDPGYMAVAGQSRLNLIPGVAYRLEFTVLITAAAEAEPIRVCLDDAGMDCHVFDPPIGVAQTYVVPFTASASSAPTFEFKRDVEAVLSDISVVRDGALADFQTMDKRETWRNDNSLGRGLIWPDGPASEGSSAVADWCGVVFREPAMPLTEDWSLCNGQLAIDGGQEYRICFDYRAHPQAPLTLAAGQVRVTNGSGVISDSLLLFAPTADWQRTKTIWFTVPGDDNRVQFGVWAVNGDATGMYLVDNILVQGRPSTVYVDYRNTGFEDGTEAYPYNTVAEGIDVVLEGGEVIIADGTYSENMTVNKPVTLRASGGHAIIGG